MGLSSKIISYRLTLFSIIICRILDVFTTQVALNNGAFEVNPFARFIFNMIGVNNVIYTLPFHILITVLGVYAIYYILSHTVLHNHVDFYLNLWNFIIILLITLNIICPVNNLLVIGGII